MNKRGAGSSVSEEHHAQDPSRVRISTLVDNYLICFISSVTTRSSGDHLRAHPISIKLLDFKNYSNKEENLVIERDHAPITSE